MNRPIFFIVNARIGSKKISEFTRAILLHIADQPHEVHQTTHSGHALELAKIAIQKNASMVVAVGGDGTVNEVLQSMVYSDIPMAIVPTGSGNGLARHCGIPIEINKAVELILKGQYQKIDIGKINERFFISNAGVGFDAWVCNKIKQTKSRGLKMYILEVIKNYFSYKSVIYTIETDTKTITEKGFFLNIANGKEFGYGFQIAPNASLQDGLLDLILVRKITPISGMKFVWDGWKKKLLNNENCLHLRAKKISITSANLKYFQADGDAQDCDGKCIIEIYPKSLKLLVSEKAENL